MDRSWIALLRASQRRDIAGVEVYVYDSPWEVKFERISEALDLIGQVSPWRLSRIQNDIQRVLVVYPLGAQFVASIHGCRLGEDVLASPVVEIAMTIIHEATHARIHKRGIVYDTVSRQRIERLCVKMEVAFASRIPGSESLIAQARNRLSHPWVNTATNAEVQLSQLRAMGISPWLARGILMVSTGIEWALRVLTRR